jgi:aspartyl protease family protein
MERTGKIMWIIFWCLVLAALAYYFNDQINAKFNPNQQVKSIVNQQQTSIILNQNSQGHYIASGTINGQSVNFLLDTGATLISIPFNLAKQLNLSQGKPYPVSTANGQVTVFSTKIASLKIGALAFKDLEGHLNPGMKGNTILLGMNALKHLDLRQKNNTLTLSTPTND